MSKNLASSSSGINLASSIGSNLTSSSGIYLASSSGSNLTSSSGINLASVSASKLSSVSGGDLVSWSGGKDALLSLQACLKHKRSASVELFCILNANEVGYHGVSKALILEQAKSLGLSIHFMEPDINQYEQTIQQYLFAKQVEGFNEIYFGDIFLEDVKDYKLNMYNIPSMKLNFPNWQYQTKDLIQEFIHSGNEAIIVSCIPELKEFCGQQIDSYLINQLPKHIDPCGENGEYHTFVTKSPEFKYEINLSKGEVEYVAFDYENLQFPGYYYQKIDLI